MKASDIQVVIVQETQPPLGAGDEQEGADAASGHRTDTADDHNQQNLIGHCRLEHRRLNGSLVHGQQTS